MLSVGHHDCPFSHLVKAWWWNLITFLNFTKAFRGYTQDFKVARLILTLPACKWLQKVGRSCATRSPLSKSASDLTLGKYSKLLLCQYRKTANHYGVKAFWSLYDKCLLFWGVLYIFEKILIIKSIFSFSSK